MCQTIVITCKFRNGLQMQYNVHLFTLHDHHVLGFFFSTTWVLTMITCLRASKDVSIARLGSTHTQLMNGSTFLSSKCTIPHALHSLRIYCVAIRASSTDYNIMPTITLLHAIITLQHDHTQTLLSYNVHVIHFSLCCMCILYGRFQYHARSHKTRLLKMRQLIRRILHKRPSNVRPFFQCTWHNISCHML